MREHPSGINSPAFRAWLDDVSFINETDEPTHSKCDRCGTAVGTQPFFGEYCLFCCAYHFGRYEKSMELATFARMVLRTIQRSSLVDLAQEIEDINWDTILPLANSKETKQLGDVGAGYRWSSP